MNLTDDNSVQINKFYLTGAKVDKQSCLSQLKKTAWNIKDSKKWYFIRSLHIKTSLNSMSDTLNLETRKVINQAVPITQVNSLNSNCIYFETLLELLIYLSIDVADKQVSKKWYWQQWKYLQKQNTPHKLISIWIDYIDYLPAIITGLSNRHRLTQLWQQPSDQEFEQLLYYLCTHLGIDYSLFNIIKLNPSLGSQEENSRNSRLNRFLSHQKPGHKNRYRSALLTPQPFANTLDLPEYLNTIWADVFETCLTSPARPDAQLPPALKVACLLIINDSTPTVLKAETRKIQQQVQNIVRHFKQLSGLSVATDHSQDILNSTKFKRFNRKYSKKQKLSNIRNTQNTTQADSDRKSVSYQKVDEFSVLSQYGGIFYLVNILANPDHASLLESSPLLETNHAGYKLLLQLALWISHAQQRPDYLDQPLLRLFKKMCHCANNRDLLMPDMTPLCEIITARCREDDRLNHLINPQLLLKKAYITLTSSHLDIYYSEQDIDLDIRMTGLDINPGWVSWLGRVVTFHYQKMDAHL